MVPLAVAGACILEIEPVHDERGYFARTFCADELTAVGAMTVIAQQSISWNARAGTLRGMHWQDEPNGEEKIVRCTAGAVFDVIVDTRPDSPTYRVADAIRLDARSHNAVYIPRGVAHGFLTLTDETELLYQMSTPYDAPSQRGLRWDDPGLSVTWPMTPVIVSERDTAFPDHVW